MTWFLVLLVFGFALLANAIVLPNWLLFTASLAMITVFVLYGKDRKNVRSN